VLDPAWAALVMAVEVPAVGAGIKVILDEAKIADRRGEATAAANVAQANLVAPAILELHQAVESERRREQVTPDGVVPEESFEDALARGRYEEQFQLIVAAVAVRSAPMFNVRRCRRLGRLLAAALGLFAILVPLVVWKQLWHAHGGPAGARTLFYSLGGAMAFVVIVFGGFYVAARSGLASSIADAQGADT